MAVGDVDFLEYGVGHSPAAPRPTVRHKADHGAKEVPCSSSFKMLKCLRVISQASVPQLGTVELACLFAL